MLRDGKTLYIIVPVILRFFWRKRQISHHKENKLARHALRTLTENIGGVQFSTWILAHHTSAGPPSHPAAVFKIAHCLVTRPREP